MDCLKEFGGFCEDLCKQSGAIIQKYFRAKIAIDNKKDRSPVTRADRESETLIRELIQKKYPKHESSVKSLRPTMKTQNISGFLTPLMAL